MIRIKRTGRRPEFPPEGAANEGGACLRLVSPKPEAADQADGEETESASGHARRASPAIVEDAHSWIRTYVDPRNIYLA